MTPQPSEPRTRAGNWRHAKWCSWERGEEEARCDCGLHAFREAAAPAPTEALRLLRELVDAVRGGDPSGSWTEREERAIYEARRYLATEGEAGT